jgi:c-di-GMP-binding flagellar brake protein YcgR
MASSTTDQPSMTRGHTRMDTVADIVLDVGEHSLPARVCNLSRSGMCVYLERAVPRGTRFSFQIPAGDQLFEGTAECVWSEAGESSEDPSRVGLRFLTLDEGGAQRIAELLERFIRSGGEPIDLS